MNGVHDMGGLQGFGSVVPEADEPVFHSEWERRVFALNLAMAPIGGWNIDMSRHARERLPASLYLSSSYYQIWLGGLETLLREHGLATAEEIGSGRMTRPPRPVRSVVAAGDVAGLVARGGSVDRPAPDPARFTVGDSVRAVNVHPPGHTRLPRYVRGHTGVVHRVHGCHVFPDTHALGLGESPTWVYSVRFSSQELWGPNAAAGDHVHVDVWEPHLEPA